MLNVNYKKNLNYIQQITNFWRKCFHLNFCLQITFSNNSIYIFPPQLTEFTWIKVIIATPKMAINVKINTLNFDNKLKDCSSRRATEDHVTIRKIRGYKAKLGLGFFMHNFKYSKFWCVSQEHLVELKPIFSWRVIFFKRKQSSDVHYRL